MPPALLGKKGRSHQRILGFAAQLLRERGTLETSVEEVMRAAGLTHGGFYAHFRDKGSLVADALDVAFGEARHNVFGPDLPARGEKWLARATGRYLSRNHLQAPGSGCAIPSLSAEIARSDGSSRRVLARNIRAFIDEIEARMVTVRRPARRRAITILALWVGGMTLARAVTDKKLADEILAACRDELLGASP